jgi:hypothetical protein
MSLKDTNHVDAMGIENETGHAVLTIVDSWEWDDEHSHLMALQAKLNAYFEFIESGQVWDRYPAARGRQLIIDIVTRYHPSRAGMEFLQIATKSALQLDVRIRQRTVADA